MAVVVKVATTAVAGVVKVAATVACARVPIQHFRGASPVVKFVKQCENLQGSVQEVSGKCLGSV